MSTICKIDHNVRRARTERREAIISLDRVYRGLSGNLSLPGALTAMARAAITLAALIGIRANPAMSAARKNALFLKAITTQGATT